jgi:hypothetical protein
MTAVKKHQQARVTKDTTNAANVGKQSTQLPAVPALQMEQPAALQKKENKTGLPDSLKAGVETLSGVSMDDAKVHYNSPKPAQLNAFAYAQGANIHVAPGQEKHLPHEAWHVAQQKQGRVKATMQMKGAVPVNDDARLEQEADVMGAKAAQFSGDNITTTAVAQTASQDNDDVVQGVFTFRVKTDDYTIVNTNYYRVQQTKYMTGNQEHKHVTADSVKDALWTGMEGMTLDAFGRRLMQISDEYLDLPGLEMLETHKLFDEDNPINAGLNQAMIENSATFDQVMADMPRLSSELNALIQTFELAHNQGNANSKNMAAFFIQNKALELIESMDKFRDMMPLVNVISGIQKGAHEREAKAFLKDGTTSVNVNNNLDALWAFFDFAAIEEMTGDTPGAIRRSIRDSLPWVNMLALENLATEKVAIAEGVEPSETSINAQDILDTVAIMMLRNHIKLTKLSYPAAALASKFDSEENIRAQLVKHGSPVTRKTVAYFACNGW